MGEFQNFILEDSENVIDKYIREDNAAMIYWHHANKNWDYFLGSDAKLFKQEMKNLIQQIKNGKILNVSKGAVVEVKGTQLYPVEFEVKNVQCGAYFMVAKRGLLDDLSITPYFFRSEEKRDEIFDYLSKKGRVKTSSS